MVRVCFSMVLLMSLGACSAEQAKSAGFEQVKPPSGIEKLVACTGLPVEGQKCGLSLKKVQANGSPVASNPMPGTAPG
jgi:hypothetical protein